MFWSLNSVEAHPTTPVPGLLVKGFVIMLGIACECACQDLALCTLQKESPL